MVGKSKINPFKSFFTSPISYIAGIIALGSVVFAWGVSSANKKSDVSSIGKDQTEMKADVKGLKESISTIRTDQQTILTILPTIIYNQNVLKEDFLKHIAHDSTAIKILELSNEFKGMSEQLKKKYQTLQNINTISELKR